MPTYEYLCQECGQEFEAFHSMKDDPIADCRLCGAEGTVKRKIGRGAGIIFKGSGFYETDFKDKKGSKSGASSSGKSESKETTSPASESASEKPSKKAESTASTSTSGAASE